MKTAISVPDETFEKASRRAHELGVSRSEFFSRAAARYVEELDAESITAQINEALDTLTRADDSAAAAVEAQAAVAALHVVLAGLRADHARLEMRLRERGMERGQQRGQRQQRQRPAQGQVVGSPDYTGCNFRLPGGALCGNPGHARVDHPG